ncbi:MAG: YybH family protein [Gemmatimonadales bacterium]|jgi:uncharacterized protein (TIGR02246 family)
MTHFTVWSSIVALLRLRKYLAIAMALTLIAFAHTTAAQSTDSSTTAAIRGSIAQFSSAWSRSDAAAIAQLFAEDGDLVIPTGMLMRGREAVREFYASAFAHGYAGSTTHTDIVGLRSVAPDVMLIDATWSISGARDATGHQRPEERGILVAVAVNRGGRWLLEALREQEGAIAVTRTGPQPRITPNGHLRKTLMGTVSARASFGTKR